MTIVLPRCLPILSNIAPGARHVSLRCYLRVLGSMVVHAAALSGLVPSTG
jgi:hypothetical protein